MAWEDRIEINPEILVGKPVVKGTRLAVEFIIDLMGQGWSEQEILDNYPGLAREDIQACSHKHRGFESRPLRSCSGFVEVSGWTGRRSR